MPSSSRTRSVVRLGIAHTLAWASSFYLPAILASRMAANLGLERRGAFALWLSAGVGLAALTLLLVLRLPAD